MRECRSMPFSMASAAGKAMSNTCLRRLAHSKKPAGMVAAKVSARALIFLATRTSRTPMRTGSGTIVRTLVARMAPRALAYTFP